MKKYIGYIIAGFLFIPQVFSQNEPNFPTQGSTWSEQDIMGISPYGIRMGFSVTSFSGTELSNPRPMLGYTGGFYYFWKPNKKKKLEFQNEVNIHFQGSNFANEEYGNTGYRRITLLSAELPFYAAIPLTNSEKEEGRTRLLVGPQWAFNLRSAVLQGPFYEPVEKDNYLSSWESLPFKPMHFNAVIGVQRIKGVLGYQIKIKRSITNLNDQFYLPKNLPETGKGGTIFPWSVEFCLVF